MEEKKIIKKSEQDGMNVLDNEIHVTPYYMGLVARKSVFGVSDIASFKPIFSATETS